jgi:Na+-driven multidrug efflux pump
MRDLELVHWILFSFSFFFSSFNFEVVVLGNCRDGLKFDELGLEILTIALPAALALAADPIASLVDTAFVGHLGTSVSILILGSRSYGKY